MRPVYTRLLAQLEQQFVLVIAAVLIIATLFLHPTVSARWNTVRTGQQLETFIAELQDTQKIDPQSYWQFRQTYSPGYFTTNQAVIGHGMTYTLTRVEPGITELLYYHAPRLTSTDALSDASTDLAALLEKDHLPEIVLQTEHLLLTKDTPTRRYQLTFITSIEDLRAANGFFDYTAEEQKLLEGQSWYNTTAIRY